MATAIAPSDWGTSLRFVSFSRLLLGQCATTRGGMHRIWLWISDCLLSCAPLVDWAPSKLFGLARVTGTVSARFRPLLPAGRLSGRPHGGRRHKDASPRARPVVLSKAVSLSQLMGVIRGPSMTVLLFLTRNLFFFFFFCERDFMLVGNRERYFFFLKRFVFF